MTCLVLGVIYVFFSEIEFYGESNPILVAIKTAFKSPSLNGILSVKLSLFIFFLSSSVSKELWQFKTRLFVASL